ncbi:DUF3093 domain-containing protein [Nesterenkonia populi]
MAEKVIYSEKLWPSWWLWTAAVLIGASFSTIFFPIDIFWGVLSMIAGISLCAFALVVTTPRVEVTETHLRAGRAQIERGDVGRVVGHTEDAAREQLGPGFDARSYQCVRGWIGPVITAEITDPSDPTPYWLFSTRNPQDVLSALGSAEQPRSSTAS